MTTEGAENQTAARRTPLARAARGGLTYAFLNGLQRALPFLLLPLYAAVLRPEDFGQIAILTAVTGLVAAIFAFGLEPYVLRTYILLESRPLERDRFLNSLGLFAIAAPFAGGVVGAAAVVGYAAAAPDASGLPILAIVAAFLASALQTTSSVFVSSVLRAREDLRGYAIVSLAQTLGVQLLTVLFVVVLAFGVAGWFAAAVLGSAIALVIGLLAIDHHWTRDFSRTTALEGLRYGLPLVPHSLSHWALNLSDRLVLAAFVTSAAVGVYNVAYLLAAPIGLILIAARQAAMPIYANAANDDATRTDLAGLATLQVHLAAVLGLGVALLGPELVGIAFPAAYQPSAELIPWIALGYVLFGLYLVPVDSLSLMLGRTTWLWVPTALAAASNIGLNLFLIPQLGVVAAAIDTAVAYGVLLAGVIVLRRMTDGPTVPYDLARMTLGLLIIVAVLAVAFLATQVLPTLPPLAVKSTAFAIGALLVLWFDWGGWRGRTQPARAMQPVDPTDRVATPVAGAHRG